MIDKCIDFDNIYTSHQLGEIDKDKCMFIRIKCRELAELIDGSMTNCREKSLALTKIEEVMFWANAGIARSSKYGK